MSKVNLKPWRREALRKHLEGERRNLTTGVENVHTWSFDFGLALRIRPSPTHTPFIVFISAVHFAICQFALHFAGIWYLRNRSWSTYFFSCFSSSFFFILFDLSLFLGFIILHIRLFLITILWNIAGKCNAMNAMQILELAIYTFRNNDSLSFSCMTVRAIWIFISQRLF